MIATDKLRGIIAERGLSQRKVADRLKMTEKTFYAKMKRGVFDSDEMAEMVSFLAIDNPGEIFLQIVVRVTQQSKSRHEASREREQVSSSVG